MFSTEPIWQLQARGVRGSFKKTDTLEPLVARASETEFASG